MNKVFVATWDGWQEVPYESIDKLFIHNNLNGVSACQITTTTEGILKGVCRVYVDDKIVFAGFLSQNMHIFSDQFFNLKE